MATVICKAVFIFSTVQSHTSLTENLQCRTGLLTLHLKFESSSYIKQLV